MIIKAFDVTRVELIRYEPRTKLLFLKAVLSDGSVMDGEFVFGRDIFALIEGFVQWVKKNVSAGKEDDDNFLQGVRVVSLKNDEDLRNGLYNSFVRFDARLRSMQTLGDASTFMHRYSALQTLKEVLYSKG